MSDTKIKAIIIITVFFVATLATTLAIVYHPTYNQRFENGISVVNCKYNQNIADLDDPYNNNRIVGVVINGYCAESDYDIVVGNRIKELNTEIKSLQQQITSLREQAKNTPQITNSQNQNDIPYSTPYVKSVSVYVKTSNSSSITPSLSAIEAIEYLTTCKDVKYISISYFDHEHSTISYDFNNVPDAIKFLENME